jgi:LysR family transcriptional regulator, transcriptional activator of nhaA
MAIAIPRLNYQHLLYFWTVVRTGSLTRACEELHLSAPTVSAQLRTFEERIGEKLLMKSGRTLAPTETGRLVYSYADEIFGLGGDLLNALAQRPTRKPLRLAVGIDDVLPKEIAHWLIEPAFSLQQSVQLVCREGTLEHLVSALQVHELDVVLSDSPITPSLTMRAHNHRLGGCDTSWVAAPALARQLRAGFPKSLDGAAVLLPTADTAIRRSLDQWLDRHGVRPHLVGEFEDYGLLREFARVGRGVAPAPDALIKQLGKHSGLARIGQARRVRSEFYAISLERKIKHPGVLAMCEHGTRLFGE